MCRIFGVSYGDKPESLTPGEIAERLFPAYVQGGPHAYGYMQYQDEEGITYDKWKGRSDTELAMDRVYYGIKPDTRWWVGHTRWLTNGSADNMNNNHPIPHGNIIGVHNGKLDNHDSIFSRTGRQVADTQVDSEAIFAAVNKWGPRKGLRRIKGKMVTVFADRRRPDRLFIARSHSRYLHVGWTRKGNFIFGTERKPLEDLEVESGIRFVKFSTVGEYRLLCVYNGQIVERGTYLDGAQLAAVQRESLKRQIAQKARLEAPRRPMWGPGSAEVNRGEVFFGPHDMMMTSEEYLEHLAGGLDSERLEDFEDIRKFLDEQG